MQLMKLVVRLVELGVVVVVILKEKKNIEKDCAYITCIVHLISKE